MLLSRLVRPLAVALAAIASAATACNGNVTATPGPEPAVSSTSGALTVDWSINGTKDPNQCSQTAAAAIEVTVLDLNQQAVGTFQQSCTAFATSITLDAGSYAGRARLIDALGRPRTTSILINQFTLLGNSEFSAPIDFPARSFL